MFGSEMWYIIIVMFVINWMREFVYYNLKNEKNEL